jgi:hypothetical protein
MTEPKEGESNGINLQDPIGKWVERRRHSITTLNVAWDNKEYARGWTKAMSRPLGKKGVFRFHSHEEADQWFTEMMTRPETG